MMRCASWTVRVWLGVWAVLWVMAPVWVGHNAASAASMASTADKASSLAVTTGMGYKTMLSELCAAYEQTTGMRLTQVYSGTIGQSLAQYAAGSGVKVFVSDKAALEESSVSFATLQPLGTDVLVLAWKKGLHLDSPDDLTQETVQSIGYPDSKGAIYGKAADRFLKQSGLAPRVQAKLRMVSTVPQVFSYLSAGELDAGFLNTAIVRAQGTALGGFMELKTGYDPIVMVAGVVQEAQDDPQAAAFLRFLGSPEARSICMKHGLR